MGDKVSDFLVKRLAAWGVKRIYGYPGDGINGVIGALDRNKALVEFVQVGHEEIAALMACAHAKSTGEVGVCLATSGPGAIHMLNGLYDARLDRQPVVALVGQQARYSLGGHFQQEVDLMSLYKDVAGAYLHMLTSPMQARQLVDRAVRIAQAERTVTAIILPHDVQDEDAVGEIPHKHGTVHTGIGLPRPPRVIPADEDLRRAADVLNAGRKVAVLVGAGALGATDEVLGVADVLGAGVAKSLLGKAVVPDDLPFVTGSIGWLGTAASQHMMTNCDTLLMVGSSNPYTEGLPPEGQARGVQIDIDGARLGLRYPMEVNLQGDSAETLRALLPLLRRKEDHFWRREIEGQVADSWRTLGEWAMHDAPPVNPQRVFHELSARLPDDCIIAGDCGSSTVWAARYLKMRRGMLFANTGTLATMGSAVPYALGAKFAHPGRPVVAPVGDGAMQMIGNDALITVAKYWRRWADPRLVVLVLNNRDLNYVTWEQRVMEADPKFPGSQDLLDFPHARYAELLGLGGIRVETPEAVGPALDRALAADRPVVVEVMVNADVPPTPPHLMPEQAQKLGEALAKGDPDAAGVREQVAAEGVM